MENARWLFIGTMSATALFTAFVLFYLDSLVGPSTRLVVIAGNRSFVFYDRACNAFLGEFTVFMTGESNRVVLADKDRLTVLPTEKLSGVLTTEEWKEFNWHQSSGWGTTCVIRKHPLARKIEELQKWEASGLAWSNKTSYESSKNNNYPIMPF